MKSQSHVLTAWLGEGTGVGNCGRMRAQVREGHPGSARGDATTATSILSGEKQRKFQEEREKGKLS